MSNSVFCEQNSHFAFINTNLWHEHQKAEVTHLSCCPWECWCWAERRRSSVWTAEFWLPGRYSTRPWSTWMPNTASAHRETTQQPHTRQLGKNTFISLWEWELKRVKVNYKACGTCSVCALGCNPDTRLSTCRRGTGSRFFMSEGNRSWM